MRKRTNLHDAASWVTVHEEVLDIATSMFLDAYEETIGSAGDRPFESERSNLLDQIEDFLAVVEQGMAGWQMKIAEWAQTVGPVEAEKAAWRESTRLWKAIENMGGIPAVRTAILMRKAEMSKAALREANRLLAKPKATIVPMPVPMDPVQYMDDILSDAAAAVPAVGPFPTWPKETVYQGIFPPAPGPSMDTVPIGGGLEGVI